MKQRPVDNLRLIIRSATLCALLACCLHGAQAAAQVRETFPRLGAYRIQTPHPYDDPGYQRDLAKLDVVIINLIPDWEINRNTTFASVIDGIKSFNPDTLVIGYVNINELQLKPGTVWEPVYNKVQGESWWLYSNGNSGTPVASTWSTGFGIINYSNFAPKDAGGDRFNTWIGKWLYQELFQGAGFDGVFTDNFFWEARVDGDWNRDGVKDDNKSENARRWHREGMIAHAANMRQLMPGAYVLGNIGGWGVPGATYPEFEQQLDGGLLERFIGFSWSPEGIDWTGADNGWGSWATMMERYRKVMGSVGDSAVVIFNHYGDPSDLRTFRYGLTSSLMDDAYYDFQDAQNNADIVWFDEFDVELGRSISPPPESPWQKGVYRRDFEFGVVLVNPRGNGAQDLELEAGLSRLIGLQDPAHNNGEAATSLRIADRDGIILLRDASLRIPKPPQLFTVR